MSYGVVSVRLLSLSKHCYFCKIHLCETCVGKHLSEDFKEHIIVPFEERKSNLKCSIHSTEICSRYCKRCKIPICALCISLGQHKQHKTMNLQASEKFTFRKILIHCNGNRRVLCAVFCVLCTVYGVLVYFLFLVNWPFEIKF